MTTSGGNDTSPAHATGWAKTALLSVSDKTGLLEFARGLAQRGYALVSTGGTLLHLQKGGLTVVPVDELTGHPEILGGRVKTLHPKVHGGILARRGDPQHMAQLQLHGIGPIDLVCVNLYPFTDTVAKPNVTYDDAIENIDIGGPTLMRAAAKNHDSVTVVSDPADYEAVLLAVQEGGADLVLRRELARKAFQHTANYDRAIAAWFSAGASSSEGAEGHALPDTVTLTLRKQHDLRYGENPHQQAAYYTLTGTAEEPSVASAQQLGGKQLSFNNMNDTDAALRLVLEFDVPAAVAVKHTNPCGVGLGPDLATAFARAYRADEVSIFGGIVALNRRVDLATAQQLAQVFLEVIIAPDYDEEAQILLQRKKSLRLLRTGHWPGTRAGDGAAGVAGASVAASASPGAGSPTSPAAFDMKRVRGGLLLQSPDPLGLNRSDWRTVTSSQVADDDWRQVELAWLVCKHVKSNAIVLARNDMTLGVGAGQMNRIDAARHALAHAAAVTDNPHGARGAVLASDAFFPFPDVVEAAAAAGVKTIVQPGGSVRDDESIEAANRAGLAMVFTGERHFRH